MKYVNNRKTSISLSIVTEKTQSLVHGQKVDVPVVQKKIEFKSGAGSVNLTDEEAKALAANSTIVALVAERQLRFPEVKELESVFGQKEAQLKKRKERLSSDKPKDKAASGDAKELKKLIAEKDAQIESQGEKIEEQGAQLEALQKSVDALIKAGASAQSKGAK